MTVRRVMLVCAAVLVLAGCSRDLPRDTPEATIVSARAIIEAGRADRLHEFIYTEPGPGGEEMRRLLRRTGVFFGSIQKLGDAVQTRFPDDVAALKAKADDAAKNGKATGLLSQLTANMGGGNRRRRTAQQDAEAREAFDAALKRLFADPYAFLRESEGKLTTIPLGDNAAALMWEGKPVLAPIGMTMQKGDDGRWAFVLPTNVPGLSSAMPKNKDQYQILGGLIQVFDNVTIDLRKDVEAGRVTSMDELARRAGEKTFIPAAIGFFAYAKYEQSLRDAAKAK